MDKIDWSILSINENAIDILQKNLHRTCFRTLSSNLNIFDLDYKFLKLRIDIIREESMMKIYNPIRFEKYLTMGYHIADDTYIII